MRSILVTLDDTPSSLVAWKLAVLLARRTGAAIRGATGIEVSDLDRVEAAPIGGAEYAYASLMRREKLAQERRARIAELPAAFQSFLAEEGMTARCATMTDDVRAGILREIETCDLVVTGRDTEFHLEARDGAASLVQHIVARGARPVVVSGPAQVGDGPVLVAYDGSAPAAKALQLAALLGIFGTSGAHILSVREDHMEASRIAGRAEEFLKLHGIRTDLDPCASTDDPADLLLKRAAQLNAHMLVMGAFGHRGLREILFGSCTRRLLDSASLPLFIYH